MQQGVCWQDLAPGRLLPPASPTLLHAAFASGHPAMAGQVAMWALQHQLQLLRRRCCSLGQQQRRPAAAAAPSLAAAQGMRAGGGRRPEHALVLALGLPHWRQDKADGDGGDEAAYRAYAAPRIAAQSHVT